MSIRRMIKSAEALQKYDDFIRNEARRRLAKKPLLPPMTWSIFEGDEVKVAQGFNEGAVGRIKRVLKFERRVELEDGTVVPANFCQLLHPTTKQPVEVEWRKMPLTSEAAAAATAAADAKSDPKAEGQKSFPLVGKALTPTVQRVRVAVDTKEVLPLPPKKETEEEERKRLRGIEVMHPERDTPLHVAQERTFDPEAEISALAQRKLAILEQEHYRRLKAAFDEQEAQREAAKAQREQVQYAVWQRALAKVAVRLKQLEEQQPQQQQRAQPSADTTTAA
eukprot:TRINITY_DN93943_c0_g1_i1.p2 TRINITY_DN93943_c0_g1~~TRINITY_DN93943_c0_g1_i1.p2  ORF type:complete len:279 (-),score=89.62 TRINITY_DN93943_c0_g1_i1:34-870(-)